MARVEPIRTYTEPLPLREWQRRIPSYRPPEDHVVTFSQGLREIVHLPVAFPVNQRSVSP